MAETASHLLKRPHPEDDNAESQKRSRSNNGSPMPQTNGAPMPSKPDVNKILAAARAKAEAIKARLQGAQEAGSGTAPPATPAAASGSAMDRVAQMRARVAAASLAAAAGRSSVLAQQKPAPTPPSYTPPTYDNGIIRARGGLDVGLHPALMAEPSQDARAAKGRSVQPKFATTMANQRAETPALTAKKNQLDLSRPSLDEIKANPYYDASLGPKNTIVKERQSRQLIFNQHGKYIQQAAALRRQAQLEAMKRRIAERARQAGLDEDIDTEKAFMVPAPPEIEWWDEGLVKGESYDALDDPKNWKIDTEDSVITEYIQHPVLLEPPQEKIAPAPKPMFLTSKEQAKLRRQRRMADLKEQQAKVRLGLEPAPPPKVKKSNLMRVLGEEAVKDPTAVEARVNREIAERKNKHEEQNEERKLTKEQRQEKLAQKQESDAAHGIFVNVYRIDNLSNGRHRFKVDMNAKQNALTGVCIMHPKFNLVIVEGGKHSTRAYKKLMLQRTNWTENDGPKSVREGNDEVLAKWLEAEDEKGELKDLSLNSCNLVFEGEQKQRGFRKWLGARVCETDSQARDVLTRAKMDSFWNLAKSQKTE